MWLTDNKNTKTPSPREEPGESLPRWEKSDRMRRNNTSIFNGKYIGTVALIVSISMGFNLLLSWMYLHEISVTTNANREILKIISQELGAIKLLIRYPPFDDSTATTIPSSPTIPTTRPTFTETSSASKTTMALTTPPITTIDSTAPSATTIASTTPSATTIASTTPSATTIASTTPSASSSFITTTADSTFPSDTTVVTTLMSDSTDISSISSEMYSRTTQYEESSTTTPINPVLFEPAYILNNRANITGRKKYTCSQYCQEPLVFKGQLLLDKGVNFTAYGFEAVRAAKQSVAYKALNKMRPELAEEVHPIDIRWVDEEPACFIPEYVDLHQKCS